MESLARIEAGAEGGALQERTTTTRTAKDGTTTTTVRERLSSSFSLTRSLNRTSTKGSPSSASRRAPALARARGMLRGPRSEKGRLLRSVAPRRAPGLTSLPLLLMASKASEVHA